MPKLYDEKFYDVVSLSTSENAKRDFAEVVIGYSKMINMEAYVVPKQSAWH